MSYATLSSWHQVIAKKKNWLMMVVVNHNLSYFIVVLCWRQIFTYVFSLLACLHLSIYLSTYLYFYINNIEPKRYWGTTFSWWLPHKFSHSYLLLDLATTSNCPIDVGEKSMCVINLVPRFLVSPLVKLHGASNQQLEYYTTYLISLAI